MPDVTRYVENSRFSRRARHSQKLQESGTCGTQLSKAKAEVGCEALSSSLDAWIGNNMLQEDTSSALQAEASPCKKKSCDSIARGVQQIRLGTLSATKHGLYSSHVAQQAKT